VDNDNNIKASDGLSALSSINRTEKEKERERLS